MQPKSILHIITTIERGGAENAVATLAIAQVKAGYDVSIFPLKGREELLDYLKENGVRVLLGGLNTSPFRQVILLKNLYAENMIFHAHLPRAELLARLAFGPGKTIFTRHNAESFLKQVPRFFSSVISRWITKDSKVISISKAVLAFLISANELASNCSPSVIYYGYESRSIHSRNQGPRKDWNTLPIKIGTVSRLTEQKNIPLLLELAHLLKKLSIPFTISIVGDGPLLTQLRDKSRALQVDDSVLFLGRTNKVIDFIESLDLFILSSRYEGFGLVLLEAMDAQTPIVASNISAIPEVLGDNHPGLFQEGSLESLFSKVMAISNSGKLQYEVIQCQINRLQRFSIDKYLSAHIATYLS